MAPVTDLETWLDDNVAPDAIHWREMAREAFLAGAAAERNRIRQLVIDLRELYSEHSRQAARALPRTAEALMLRAETLGEFIGTLDDGT